MSIFHEINTVHAGSLLYSRDVANRNRSRVFTSERERKLSTPLTYIPVDPAAPLEDQEKIVAVNAMHVGAYGLSLMHDELVHKILGKVKKGRGVILPQVEQYTSAHVLEDIDRMVDFSLGVGDLSTAYRKGEPTEKLAVDVSESSQAVLQRLIGDEPQNKEKQIDRVLGMDAFLRSEADSVSLEVHDIRSPLTAVKAMMQLAQRRGLRLDEAIPDEIKDFVRQYEHKGEVMRKHLAARVPLDIYNPEKMIDALKKFLRGRPIEASGNILFPDKPPGEPSVLFNRQRLESLFENALGNAQKARALLQERFLLAAFTIVSDRDVFRILKFLDRLGPRTEEADTLEVAVDTTMLRRRKYVELAFRDNGIGNDHNNGRRRWRRNFSVGESRWSPNDSIPGTGIAMGKHREIVKELFAGTHADVFLRNRTDDKRGAELVLRLPEVRRSLY